MSRRVIGIRRGNSVQERIQNPVQNLDQLRLIPTTDVVDKAVIVVEDNGMFRYDYEGTGFDDGITTIAPDVGPGRWLFLAGSGAFTLTDVERSRAVFPVVGETDQTYTDWVEDDVTIVRIDVLLLSALTVAGTYQMTVTGAGNNLLSLPFIDLTTLTPGTITTLGLTGTALDLQLVDLDKIEINVVSNDIGLVGGDALIVHISYERAGGGGGGGGGEDLAATLAIGNVTGGTDIQIDSADAVVGEDAAATSGLDGYALTMRGGQGDGAGIQGAVRIEPVADVEKAIRLDESSATDYFGAGSYAPGAGRGLIYLDDGDVLNELQANTPYFVDGLGSFINMLGGWVTTNAYSTAGPHSVFMLRGVVGFLGPLTGSAAVDLTLPDSNLNRGRVVWVQHNGDGTGSLDVFPNGGAGNTLDGGAGSVAVPIGEFRAFFADGQGDWRTIDLGGAGGGVTGPGAVTAVNQVALWTDGTGTAIKQSTMTVVGDDANVVGTLSAAEVVAGDLVMRSEERNAAWRMIEHHGHIEVVNEKTGQRFKLALIPLED
jgi:hypothetical protein